MSKKTGNHIFLRRQNLKGILQLLYEKAPVSRVELSRLTGLNKATVSSIVSELTNEELVREVGEGQDKRAGRKELLLDINPLFGCMIGVEIGVGFISVICTDFTAEPLWRKRIQLQENDTENILVKAVSLITEAVETGDKKCGRILGIAIGIPGLIDQKSGTLLYAPNLNWKNTELLKYFRQHFEVPIFIDNEATLAALGESFFGAGQGLKNLLYISAGIGIGGGVIINGEIYNGGSGFASEFGHMTMNPAGIKCACGNVGCWETQASQAALFREIKSAINAGQTTVLKKNYNNISVQLIVAAANENDLVSLESLSKIGTFLGIGIDSLIKCFDPQIVVFGGRLSLAEKFLIPVIEKELKARRLMNEYFDSPKLIPARFGSDATIMGGIAKIFQTTLS